MESNFLLDIEKPGTRRPPARRSIFLHLQLLITQEKTRGGNCVSGNMSAPRNASMCPDRSRCCFNCAILALASRARARHWWPRQARRRFAGYVTDRHFCTVRTDTTFVGFPATSPSMRRHVCRIAPRPCRAAGALRAPAPALRQHDHDPLRAAALIGVALALDQGRSLKSRAA
jgi:hypothetical protein